MAPSSYNILTGPEGVIQRLTPLLQAPDGGSRVQRSGWPVDLPPNPRCRLRHHVGAVVKLFQLSSVETFLDQPRAHRLQVQVVSLAVAAPWSHVVKRRDVHEVQEAVTEPIQQEAVTQPIQQEAVTEPIQPPPQQQQQQIPAAAAAAPMPGHMHVVGAQDIPDEPVTGEVQDVAPIVAMTDATAAAAAAAPEVATTDAVATAAPADVAAVNEAAVAAPMASVDAVMAAPVAPTPQAPAAVTPLVAPEPEVVVPWDALPPVATQELAGTSRHGRVRKKPVVTDV